MARPPERAFRASIRASLRVALSIALAQSVERFCLSKAGLQA
jgi:hypothetical protein